ncbi:Uncharacterised protein [Chlamydia trachomatis]|nr:Uncharacterised protein [Chlamydia trachomatis]
MHNIKFFSKLDNYEDDQDHRDHQRQQHKDLVNQALEDILYLHPLVAMVYSIEMQYVINFQYS